MMMIAFISINCGLIPLIEGLCAQILYFRFEIIGGLRHDWSNPLMATQNHDSSYPLMATQLDAYSTFCSVLFLIDVAFITS